MLDLVQKITHQGTHHQPEAPILEFDHVWARYQGGGGTVNGGPYALEDVSFQIANGEQIAVIGPNGAGKSTLFRLIAGVLQPEKGAVLMYGREPSAHICIAYVPQTSTIPPSFPATVEDVVMMGRVRQIGLFRRPKKVDWEIVRKCLARVDALHLADLQIGELSGGQRQRVLIARSLAQGTDLLLLDEPLTGLDGPSQEKIFQVLDRLKGDGVTVFVATHDLNLAAERFDRVMLLNRRIISFASAAESLSTDNLLAAYGGHLHRVGGENLVVVDDCCGEEHDAH